ncbi:MAG: nucleotide pyrophosphohydrolase [Candidatus Jorgensenbacteria bacterium]
MLRMKNIQKQVDEWVQHYKVPYWQPLEIMTRLTEEVGELAREINHRYGPKKKKTTENNSEIGDEIADVVYTLVCMANSLGIDLDESFQKMMDKLYARDKDRFEKK